MIHRRITFRSILGTLAQYLPALVLALALSLPALSTHGIAAESSHHQTKATSGDGHDHDTADGAGCCHPPATGCGGFAFLSIDTIGHYYNRTTEHFGSPAAHVNDNPIKPPSKPPKRLS